MRLVNSDDVDFIADCLLDIHAESPAYSRFEIDHTHARAHLNGMCSNGYGYIEPDKGFILFGSMAQWFSPTIELYEILLYVRPEFRGGMTAIRLVKAMEGYAERVGITTIHVGTSLGISDEKAIKLYQGLGYSISSTGLSKSV
jgi:GNAT superfamily N-acetyltransferase